MLLSYLEIKSIEHPNIMKFVSYEENTVRMLLLHQYSGEENIPHVLNVFLQRFADDEIFPILNETFPFVKKVFVVATFDDDYDYLVQQTGCTVSYPYSSLDKETKYSFSDLNRFFLDLHPNIESFTKYLSTNS